MKKFQKAFASIEALATQTDWPDHVTLVKPEHAQNGGFWPQGFRSAGVQAGIKQKRRDVMLLLSDTPAAAASVYTTNTFAAAPIIVTREHMDVSSRAIRAIVCNSGNANAATGVKGIDDARTMAIKTASVLGIEPEQVVVSSTGVIGVPLPADKISKALDLAPDLLQSATCFDAAEAIMTTDTFPKFFALDVALSTGTVRISGIAKGSGMICPDMATMLAFLATDAAIEQSFLQHMLVEANRSSFNAITVDGDTSTNDMVTLLAGGKGIPVIEGTPDAQLFFSALSSLMTFLAKLIVLDGEGATKLVEVRVQGARTDRDAEHAARTVANSNLVKTAIHGEDANWGRIIGALGRSGAHFDPEEVAIDFDGLDILKPGLISSFSEEEAKKIMQKSSFAITVSLGHGEGRAVVWTCDLSKEYIEINGSYRS
ncbi:bifunctional glutamate N-acetyltransferase/amino-acid acetyltransferase ArgJ [Prosthecochloris sp. CIB 2401]|uniref:bifunctional glutamate N-acetyltransferase/amino-acid acetyltransferase ArgJ n=1 Tax=Prosthecochloris sp. CIB 2401 TaxID=1868325 RepID=UPI00080AB9EE|nr:bifunctional glutamate N-acetyltransferase/amino-acid acetyltransferase ArgJ [Prosthecochloris sp. CIB 2401]ANT64882.1 Arginine biosynthesis bifunctional protein ArgJ [Prosthecochloris sp. CIB 2401]